jgi:hypothetical protein
VVKALVRLALDTPTGRKVFIESDSYDLFVSLIMKNYYLPRHLAPLSFPSTDLPGAAVSVGNHSTDKPDRFGSSWGTLAYPSGDCTFNGVGNQLENNLNARKTHRQEREGRECVEGPDDGREDGNEYSERHTRFHPTTERIANLCEKECKRDREDEVGHNMSRDILFEYSRMRSHHWHQPRAKDL